MNEGITYLIPAGGVYDGKSQASERFLHGLTLVFEYLQGLSVDWEVIFFAQGGSSKSLFSLLPGMAMTGSQCQFTMVEGEKAFGEACAKSRYPTVLLYDVRSGIPAKESELLLNCLEGGCDIAVGSRFVKGESVAHPADSRTRVLMWREKVLRWGARLGRSPLWDIRSGLLAFKKPLLEKAVQIPRRFGAKEIERCLVEARRAGLSIKEVGIMWKREGLKAQSLPLRSSGGAE